LVDGIYLALLRYKLYLDGFFVVDELWSLI
jgi:hypothetical protein